MLWGILCNWTPAVGQSPGEKSWGPLLESGADHWVPFLDLPCPGALYPHLPTENTVVSPGRERLFPSLERP